MRLLGAMAENFRARPLLEPGEIPRVIQMPMRKQNGLDGLRRKTEPAHQPTDEKHFAEHSGINHHHFATIHQQEAATHDAANGMDAWGDVPHGE
jgi:hypothetical protein